jgi:hypothetical protein
MPILFRVQQLLEGTAAVAAAKPLSDYYQRLAARASFQNTMPPPAAPTRPR